MSLVTTICVFLRGLVADRGRLAAENLALRQPVAILKQRNPRPKLRRQDRIFWVWLARLWAEWRSALILVKPETIIRWHRQGSTIADCRLKIADWEEAHPTAAWTAQQGVEAFPYETAPRFLIHDRDAVYGDAFRRRVRHMGIQEVLIAPQAPWQNPYVERLIGSIRRDCLDHAIVLGETHLRRLLAAYLAYYHRARPHLALARNAPVPRTVEPRSKGRVIALPHVGGLHHRYARAA